MKKKALLDSGISISEIQKILTEDLKVFHDFCEEHGLRYSLAYGTMLGAVRHDGCIPWDDDVDVFMPRRDYLRFLELAQEKGLYSRAYRIQTPETDRKYPMLYIPLKIRSRHATLIEEPKKKYYQGAFIDVFPLDYIGDDEAAFQKLKKKCAMISSLKMRISFQELSGIKRYIRILLQLVFKLIPAHALYRWQQKQIQKVADNDRAKNRDMTSGIELVMRTVIKEEDFFPLALHAFGPYAFYIPHNYDSILTEEYGDYMTPPTQEQIDKALHGIFYSDRPYETYRDVDFSAGIPGKRGLDTD